MMIALSGKDCTVQRRRQSALHSYNSLAAGDLDGDGFGDPTSALDDCEAPAGYVDVLGNCTTGQVPILSSCIFVKQ